MGDVRICEGKVEGLVMVIKGLLVGARAGSRNRSADCDMA